ncbi:hypothetical protein QM012_001577 [Aureobasidium pullulans]|uniref:Apple domain-containing protein n=1 Tax=Aureobasidium pullulans TaxID=5580 RepID=A0ABR0TFD7_AURPU
MQLIFGLAVASLLKATTALVSNGTTETVFITQTAWSTVFSCPAPQTVTVCNAKCTAPSVNNANIIYQTVSDGQAGQVFTIDGTQTTLSQATAWTVENTISGLALNPAGITVNDYTASATLTDFVYPSSVTATSGEVVTCQTGVTTISDNGVVLTDCPCTVQSTVLELTATAAGAIPTAVIPSNYIVKIIYVYEIEVIVEQIPITITTTAFETLTTVQTTTQTGTVTTTDNASSRPTIVAVDNVTFKLQYDTTYDGVPVGGLRKRQASYSPLISTALNVCLAQCAGQADCRAASFVEATSLCTPLIQFDALSPRISFGEIFAIVVLRPSTSSSSTTPTNVAVSTTPIISGQTAIVSSTSLRSSPSTRSEDSTIARSSASTGSSSSSLASSSSSKASASSAFYPMSNTSVSSTSLSQRSSSSSSVSLSSTAPSSTPSTSSSSEIPSSLTPTTSSLTSSTISPLTNSSIFSPAPTSTSSGSVTLPVANASTSSLTSSTPVPALTGCAVASDILGYLPAMSYCSSVYPVATYTQLFNATTTNIVTVSALNSTMYRNITLPTQTTVQTDKETTTETEVTLVVSTVIQSVTTTTTTTGSSAAVVVTPLARRQAIPSVQASIFSSILSRPATDIALVCSCLQTPTTASSSSTETVLSTASVTPIVEATNYFTPPVVTIETTEVTTTTSISTISSETTSTATAVATLIIPPYPQCDPAHAYGGAGGQGGCSSNCYCNADVDQVHAYCGSDCGADNCASCTTDADCPAGEFCDTYNFGRTTGSCYSISGCSTTYTPTKKKRFVAEYVENLLTGRSDGPLGDLNRPWLVHD